MQLQTLREFLPTQFDHAVRRPEDRLDWIVAPVSRTRDSGPLDESNFAEALAAALDEVEPHALWSLFLDLRGNYWLEGHGSGACFDYPTVTLADLLALLEETK